MNIKKRAENHCDAILNIKTERILDIANMITKAFKNGNKLLIFGNGGSAADAIHLAAEFSGKYLLDRKALPAIALSANVSTITAVANDYSNDMIFERQIESYAKQGDIVIGISTSGDSKNVLRAIEKAKEMKALTIGFSGTAGKLKDIVDYALIIPSTETPRIQEGYMFAGHIICEIVEEELYGKK